MRWRALYRVLHLPVVLVVLLLLPLQLGAGVCTLRVAIIIGNRCGAPPL
jgi:hypothetical protein